MPKSTEMPKDATVGCKINEEKKEALEKVADEKGKSVSALVREAVENKIPQKNSTND